MPLPPASTESEYCAPSEYDSGASVRVAVEYQARGAVGAGPAQHRLGHRIVADGPQDPQAERAFVEGRHGRQIAYHQLYEAQPGRRLCGLYFTVHRPPDRP